MRHDGARLRIGPVPGSFAGAYNGANVREMLHTFLALAFMPTALAAG